MIKSRIYKMMKFAVVTSFLYLLFFENVWDIDRIIMETTNCLKEEIIYFKIILIVIILIIIYGIIRYLKYNYSEFLSSNPLIYVRKHPFRTLFIVLFTIWTILCVITILSGYKNYFVLLFGIFSILLAGVIGYFLGIGKNKTM